jgi:predicted phosphodiesterase
MPAVRIAVVADIHHGANHMTKLGSSALPLLAEFRRFVAEARPDAVVDLGDRISDRDRDNDLVLAREVAEAFRPINVPRFHICGNHDRDHMDVADNAELLGQELGNTTIDLGGWRIVLWRADSRIRRQHRDGMHGFVLAEADLLWLAGVVRQADRPLAIMSHVPVSGHAQTGNYYFERNPHLSTYPGAERVRAVLRMARVPVVCIAGHVHWNTLTTVDGIPHITLQSLTESFTTHPAPAASWALLELDEAINWEVFGEDRFAHRQDAAATLRRWVPPLAPFAPPPDRA